MIQEIFAHNVKARRERIGLTQAQLAEKSGLSVGAIARVEQATRWPSPENVERIAGALSVKAYVLFFPPETSQILQSFLSELSRT